jgi:hypothetical protein
MHKEDLQLARDMLNGVGEPGDASRVLGILLALIGDAEKALAAAPAASPAPAATLPARDLPDPPDGPPTRVEGAVASPPAIAPATSTVSGSGGPQNSYEVRMTPHPRAVGMCPDCGGQLRHAPTCPQLAPKAP